MWNERVRGCSSKTIRLYRAFDIAEPAAAQDCCFLATIPTFDELDPERDCCSVRLTCRVWLPVPYRPMLKFKKID